MKLINKDGVATCFRIWKWNKFQIELVYIPRGKRVKPHCHWNMNKELIYLFGCATFHRMQDFFNSPLDKRELRVGLRSFLRSFTVKSYHTHWADNITVPLLFLLVERWKEEPKSEVTSFELSHTT